MSNHLSADKVFDIANTLQHVERDRLVFLLTGADAPQPPPKLLSVPTVAARWGVTPRTVRNWISSGELPAIKRGRAVRIPENSLYENAQPGGKVK